MEKIFLKNYIYTLALKEEKFTKISIPIEFRFQPTISIKIE